MYNIQYDKDINILYQFNTSIKLWLQNEAYTAL